MDVQRQIDDLKRELEALKQNPFANVEQIPYGLRQNILELVFDTEDTTTATTQELDLGIVGTYNVAKTPTAFLMVRWKGRLYRLPHYGDL